MNNILSEQEARLIVETHGKVLDVLSESKLDAHGMIAVLTKALIDYSILVEEREEFQMRMVMTYDFFKSMEPDTRGVH